MRLRSYSEAAREAGYSDAQRDGNRLKARLEPYIAMLMAQVEKEVVLDQTRVIKEMEPVALWTIDDYMIVERDKDGKASMRWKPFDELTKEQKRAIKNVKLDAEGEFTYEFHEKMPVLMAAGKHLGMFNERLIIQQRTVHEHRLDLSTVPTEILEEMEKRLMGYMPGRVIEGESRRTR